MNIEELNTVRKKQGLSIDELAKRSNLPKSTIEKILFGVVKHPRVDTMQAIEHALGIGDLWTAEDYSNGVINTKKVSITPLEEDLLTLFRDIGNKDGEEKQLLYLKIGETILQTTKK